MNIVMELHRADETVLKNLESIEKGTVSISKPKKFSGDADLISAIVTLTTISIPVIGKVIIELINAKKYVKIKVKGVEISGITEKNAIEVLETIYKKGRKL